MTPRDASLLASDQPRLSAFLASAPDRGSTCSRYKQIPEVAVGRQSTCRGSVHAWMPGQIDCVCDQGSGRIGGCTVDCGDRYSVSDAKRVASTTPAARRNAPNTIACGNPKGAADLAVFVVGYQSNSTFFTGRQVQGCVAAIIHYDSPQTLFSADKFAKLVRDGACNGCHGRDERVELRNSQNHSCCDLDLLRLAHRARSGDRRSGNSEHNSSSMV